MGGVKMIIDILGVIFLLWGAWGIFYAIKNRKNMPQTLHGVPRDCYRVIDIQKFNSLLRNSAYTLGVFMIALGILSIVFDSIIPIFFGVASPLIHMSFSAIAKRKQYVKINANKLRR
jgi:hypothetical protein